MTKCLQQNHYTANIIVTLEKVLKNIQKKVL
jgi:hypothetical protein